MKIYNLYGDPVRVPVIHDLSYNNVLIYFHKDGPNPEIVI